MISTCSELMTFSYPEDRFFEDNLLDADDWGERNMNIDIEDGDISPQSSSPSSDGSELQYVPDYSSINSPQYECLDSFLSNSKLLYATEGYTPRIEQQPAFSTALSEKCGTGIPVTNTGSVSILKNPTPPCPQTINNNTPKEIPRSHCIQNSKSTSNNAKANKGMPFSQNTVKTKAHKPILMKKEAQRPPVIVSTSNLYGFSLPIVTPTIMKLENTQLFVERSVPDHENGSKKQKSPKKKKREVGCEVDSIHMLSSNINELKKYKRQERLARNRESACLSRQRKKEYVNMLESRVTVMSAMNEQLKAENDALKQRIKTLENEISDFKKKSDGNFKKSSVLFVIIFIFVFNVSSGLFSLNPTRDGDRKVNTASYQNELNKQIIFQSRSLLNIDSDRIRPTDFLHLHQRPYNSNSININNRNRNKKTTGKRGHNTMKFQNSHADQSSTDCGEHLNETYIKRINNALNGLVKGLGKENDGEKYNSSSLQGNKTLDAVAANTSITKISKVKNDNCSQHKHRHRSAFFKNFRIDKFRKNLPAAKDGMLNLTSQELASVIQKSINRKPDTFYVVTSPKDFLTILPSTNNSNMRRPKVSFMIPIIRSKSNDTYKEANRLSMLKIDCKVIDTTLVHLDRNVVFRSLLTGL